jgi:hypothetical protein
MAPEAPREYLGHQQAAKAQGTRFASRCGLEQPGAPLDRALLLLRHWCTETGYDSIVSTTPGRQTATRRLKTEQAYALARQGGVVSTM